MARARLIEFCPCPQPRLSSAELDQEAKLGDDLKLERKESVRPRERRVFKVRHEKPRFAEYFLIGTLLSIGLAVIGGLVLAKLWYGTMSLK